MSCNTRKSETTEEEMDKLKRAFGFKKPKKSLGQIMEEKRFEKELRRGVSAVNAPG